MSKGKKGEFTHISLILILPEKNSGILAIFLSFFLSFFVANTKRNNQTNIVDHPYQLSFFPFSSKYAKSKSSLKSHKPTQEFCM